jgi:cytochrome c oxidase subunit 1
MTKGPAPANPSPARRALAALATCEPRPLGIAHLAILVVALLVGSVYGALARLLSRDEPGAAIGLMRTHGIVMVFLLLVPAIPTTLGNFLLPSLLETAGFALPRLRRAAMHLHAAGVAFVVVATATHGSHQGWRLFMAFSPTAVDGSVLWLAAAVAAVAVAMACSALSTLVTIHTRRPATTPWRELPTMVWGLHAASLLHVVTAPIVLVTLVLVVGERTVGLGILDPTLGGEPVLFSSLVWLVLSAALASALVAAMGTVSHLVAVYSGRSTRAGSLGPWLVVLALAGLLGWGQHLQSMSIGGLGVLESSVPALLFQLPLVVAVAAWLRTLRGGEIALRTPMLYALAFVAHLAIVAPAALLLALPGLATYLGGATFATGQLHYSAVGCTLFALLGGLHHVWRDVIGREYSEAHARIAFGGLALGTNLAFFPMLALGVGGVPHLVVLDALGTSTLATLCTIGVALTVLSLFAAVAVLVAPLFRGRPRVALARADA